VPKPPTPSCKSEEHSKPSKLGKQFMFQLKFTKHESFEVLRIAFLGGSDLHHHIVTISLQDPDFVSSVSVQKNQGPAVKRLPRPPCKDEPEDLMISGDVWQCLDWEFLKGTPKAPKLQIKSQVQ